MEENTFFKGDWKAIEKIGEGSFGVVYKAEKSQYGVKSYSAIKQIMIPQTAKDYSKLRSEGLTESDIEKSYDNQVKKWVEEIKFLEQFKENINIVSIEDFEVIERTDQPGRIINIRMELLQNVDSYFLDKVATDKDILKMAIDILNALEDCEEKNVVHRDIKPDNIFVNNKGTYKLGDFGEAKNIEKTVSNMSKKGTENYMAPEIYKGERGSKTVDTYSLGIMLYKYFNNNRLPFLPNYPDEITYENRENAIFKRMSGERINPPCNASNKISEIILKACSYKPKERYESAMELKNDILEEYRKIQEPMRLFDFQKNYSDDFDKTGGFENKTNNDVFDSTEGMPNENFEDNFDKTSGAFDNSTNIKSDFDKTSGIYENSSNIKKDFNSTTGIYGDVNEMNNFNKTVGLFGEATENSYDYTVSVFEKKEKKNQFGFNENKKEIKEELHKDNVKIEGYNVVNLTEEKIEWETTSFYDLYFKIPKQYNKKQTKYGLEYTNDSNLHLRNTSIEIKIENKDFSIDDYLYQISSLKNVKKSTKVVNNKVWNVSSFYAQNMYYFIAYRQNSEKKYIIIYSCIENGKCSIWDTLFDSIMFKDYYELLERKTKKKELKYEKQKTEEKNQKIKNSKIQILKQKNPFKYAIYKFFEFIYELCAIVAFIYTCFTGALLVLILGFIIPGVFMTLNEKIFLSDIEIK